jgi:hypothetical protein
LRAQHWAIFTVISGRQTSLIPRLSASAVVGALLIVGACTASLAQPLFGPPAADPSARVPPVDYRSTLAPFTSRRPAAPGPWREENERVAPEPKSAPNPVPKSGQSEPSR